MSFLESIFGMSPKKEDEEKDPMDAGTGATEEEQQSVGQQHAQVAEGQVLTPEDEIERKRVQGMGDSWREQQ